MFIVDGWLIPSSGDPPVVQVRSPKHSALDVPQPLGAVWHNTGPTGSDPVEFCRRAAASDRQASWHVLVTRDGRLVQGVAFSRGSWHVGRRGRVAGVERVVNACTVGIELENLGRLREIEGRWRYYVGEGRWDLVPQGQLQIARVVGEGSFQDYPEPQRAAAGVLLTALVEAYGWDAGVCGYGHVDFAAPGSREDPGPHWGCHRWPDGPVLREVLGEVFGEAPPLGLPTWVDDPGTPGDDCGGGLCSP